MPLFEYTARNPTNGQIQKGQVDLPTKEEVTSFLRKQRMMLVSVREAPKPIKINFGAAIKTRDIVIFTRQFATMINAGLPLVQSLDILAKQTENAALKEVVKQVVFDVEAGNTLADAFRKHPKAFTDLYVNMIAAGEAGGILDTILLRLATFMEKNDALVRKVKGAMVYPLVIMSVAVIAITILLIFVIPTFSAMFASVNVELPLPTRIVIAMSHFLTSFWWAILGVIAGAWFMVKRYYATSGGRKNIDTLLINSPVLGDVIRKSAVSRFTRTLGTLVSSGVAILDGLEITAKTAGNRVIHDAVMESRASIAGGDTIAGPLERSKVFPPMVVSMIAVGEQTGGLDEMLSKIADFYDEEVDVAVSALLSLMEPVMIVILGVVVGGMVIAMYLPIFDMMNAVQ
ncbi:MAG: type II secretion system F family protein [Gemmatimonadales bacterium]|jgi:type IV pilus assembly protein PilC